LSGISCSRRIGSVERINQYRLFVVKRFQVSEVPANSPRGRVVGSGDAAKAMGRASGALRRGSPVERWKLGQSLGQAPTGARQCGVP
jgi:hypothetical protein